MSSSIHMIPDILADLAGLSGHPHRKDCSPH
jgi:hypothetical protein